MASRSLPCFSFALETWKPPSAEARHQSSRLSFVHVLVAVRDCQVDSITNRAMPCRLSINDVDQRCRSWISMTDDRWPMTDDRWPMTEHRSSIIECRASISSIEHNSGMVLSLINYGWYRPNPKWGIWEPNGILFKLSSGFQCKIEVSVATSAWYKPKTNKNKAFHLK